MWHLPFGVLNERPLERTKKDISKVVNDGEISLIFCRIFDNLMLLYVLKYDIINKTRLVERKVLLINTEELIMAKKKSGSLANAIMGLPWIVRLLLAIFLDVVYGIARFVDGLAQRNVLKIIIGFLWIFYGLGIGWILDIICVIVGARPILF